MPSSIKMVCPEKISLLAGTKGVLRLTLFCMLSFVALFIQPFFLISRNQRAVCFIPKLWHRLVCKIFGIKVIVKGDPDDTEGTFFVGNHLSYLDIPVIGQNLTSYFIAKKEVETWPFFGILAKLQKTLFIMRSSSGLAEAGNDISKHVRNNNNLVIFPEGTTSDGSKVLPFKSSLFNFLTSDVYRDKITIQPFTLRLFKIDGREPVNQKDRDLYAWYGDMELHSHLWAFACSKGAWIELCFHEKLKIEKSDTRKTLCLRSYTKVNEGLTQAGVISKQDASNI